MSKPKIGFIGCSGIAVEKHLPGMASQRDRIDTKILDAIYESAKTGKTIYFD